MEMWIIIFLLAAILSSVCEGKSKQEVDDEFYEYDFSRVDKIEELEPMTDEEMQELRDYHRKRNELRNIYISPRSRKAN